MSVPQVHDHLGASAPGGTCSVRGPLSRFGAAGWSDRAMLVLRRLRSWLPQGRLLPEPAWKQRHRAIVALLWAHAIGLAAFGVVQGYGLVHSAAEAALVAGAALFASLRGPSRRLRSAVASLGLITSSALLVHIWGGAIEAHFHFFFVVGVLTLYQDWLPFLLAIVYVLLHHGSLGAIDPGSVYNHPMAVAHPWRWALIHAVFVVATSAANLVSWRVNEQLLREPLTGLPGRSVFLDRLAQSLAELHRRPATVAVIFADLDRFKLINDSLGHGAGDRLLVVVAERLRSTLRRQDAVARLGGDEFAILCHDISDEAALVAIARRFAEVVRQPLTIEGREIQVSTSLGIALTSDTAASPAQLMRDADVAMYRAKERGGDRCEVFDSSMHQRAVKRLEMESELRVALGRQQFRLVYQPEVCLTTGTIVGVEALLRWDHPAQGPIPPQEFIPVAEDTGLIVPLGAWVIQEACRQAERWRHELPGRPRLRIRVNLSPRQLSDPDLIDIIAGALADTDTDPSQLDLELTESAIMGDLEWTIASLWTLKDLGLRLSVDDFGTGHSSLSHLKNFPVDTLKVDRSFVKNLGQAAIDSALLASIVDLAHVLGLSVTAEGVEHQTQLEDLKRFGCDTAQGYLLAHPLAPDAVTELLAQEGPHLPESRRAAEAPYRYV
jgi:diguanylate cyclase (GGDEF)-like protein